MTTPETDADRALDALSQRLILEYWDFYPTAGSRIGRHQYDGRLPDLSPGSLARRIEQVQISLGQVTALGSHDLSPPGLLSQQLMELFLRREHFSLTEMRPLANNPMRQVGYLNVSGYLQRDYAPLTDRLRSATQVLEQVPDFLEALDGALIQDPGLPVLDMSIESYAGMARFYRVDLGQAAGDSVDGELQSKFDRVREEAAQSIDRFVQRLDQRKLEASPDFAIGSDLYTKMLSSGEGLDVPLAQLLDLGQANLRSNLEQLTEVAQIISPGRPVSEIAADIGRNHPTADALIPETQDMLEEIRQALIDLEVISVPAEDRCRVIETPTYMRYAFAAMDSPGSLETRATESFYYVTPVEADWTPQQQEEWLANFNYDTLRIISVHEVYPGHFVHHLHNRYRGNLPLINQVATSYAFTEGWAHYTEQMILETGYAPDQPTLRFTQLLEALVRNCRYMCSLWMHTQGMTVEDATQYFMDNAYMGELPARREALRGTFDPGYLNYTLGKLMILKLREDYRREQGADYSLKGFHDRLLSYGAPALPLVRQAMLRDPGISPV
ncbi:MAG: DUF885 domain-containing protein [Chloroflexi bacterium]|nr:DUF885 domain-containing protein [Chloroflexota bacterium]MCI0793374.1 DUF885 domain-containing protein [Chloroflexota bacterium]